jgi:hypothetical protein
LKEFGFEKHLGRIAPQSVLSYELHYTINGVKQVPWKNSAFPGQYPEIGFNGIWRIKDYLRYFQSPRVCEVLQIYHNGKELEIAMDDEKPIKLPLNGTFVKGSDKLGHFKLSAKEVGKDKERIILQFKYNKDEFDLKRKLLSTSQKFQPKIKDVDQAGKKVADSMPELKQKELNFEHSIELEILYPSHKLAVHGIYPTPIIYTPL